MAGFFEYIANDLSCKSKQNETLIVKANSLCKVYGIFISFCSGFWSLCEHYERNVNSYINIALWSSTSYRNRKIDKSYTMVISHIFDLFVLEINISWSEQRHKGITN